MKFPMIQKVGPLSVAVFHWVKVRSSAVLFEVIDTYKQHSMVGYINVQFWLDCAFKVIEFFWSSESDMYVYISTTITPSH